MKSNIRMFDVYISKAYFPRVSGEQITDRYESWRVQSTDRVSAAQKVWDEHGERLLAEMIPHEGLPRRVSRFVNDPVTKTNASRLVPITVEGEMRRFANVQEILDAVDKYQDKLSEAEDELLVFIRLAEAAGLEVELLHEQVNEGLRTAMNLVGEFAEKLEMSQQ